MDLGKDGCRLGLRNACVCAVALMLSSCAQQPPPGTISHAAPARPASAGRPASPATVAKMPASRPAATERSAPERRPRLAAIVPRREPTRAEQIIMLVREGYFVDQVRGVLVFSKSRPPKEPNSGLYEDAILLGRLRYALKETEGIPDSLATTATVRDAKALLSIEENLPASEAARAIDAALCTPGVTAVQARISR